MICKISITLLMAALLPQVLHAEHTTAPQGPPPRFLTVRSVDQVKGEVIFDIQIVVQSVLDQLTLLVYPDGYQRQSLGTKPTYAHPAHGFRVSLKAKWSGVDGKEVSEQAVIKRLKPGVMVLLSADGAPVDQEYLSLFKEGTLVLIIPAEELPLPYFPHSGGFVPVKNVRER
jgi:hypothetical protein